MISIALRLFLLTLVPIFFSIGFRVLNMYTKFRNIKPIYKQIIIGVVFGMISIFGTICGVKTTSNAVINIRDVGPMCAGFIFGGLSGIIAGLIGGIYRFVSAFLGLSGMYTVWACSISTIFAGIFTAIIRKHVFDNHHGKWYYGFGLGVLVESFHMLMVFFTHMGDIESAYLTVLSCATPMIIVNSLAVLLSLIGVAIISKEELIDKTKPIKIASKVQLWLLGLLAFAFLVISFFTNRSLSNISTKTTLELLETNTCDVRNDVDEEIDRTLYDTCKYIKDTYLDEIANKNDNDINNYLNQIKQEKHISEISLVDSEHKIKYTTTVSFINYDMDDGAQSMVFNDLIDSKEFMAQEYGPIQYDNSIKMKYAGIRFNIPSKDILYMQIGYNENDYYDVLDTSIQYSVSNRHVGNDGYILIYNESGDLLSSYKDLSIDNTLFNKLTKSELDKVIKINTNNTDMYCYVKNVNGYYIVALESVYNCDLNTNISSMAISLASLFVFLVLYCVIFVIIKKSVVDGIVNIKSSLNKISDGDLNISVNERSSDEFNQLSNDINSTVSTLKGFIEKEAKRIDDELKFAKNIQLSSLPSPVNKFKNINNIDLYALMKTAKEVGGDFYDFYTLDKDRIAILIADVSGKGIPAAMFMMNAKAIIKNLAQSNLEIDEVFNQANNKLCEGNDAMMFVTAWLAFVNIHTGHVEYVNAGHNPPLLIHNNIATYIKFNKGFILGGMENIKYKKNELDLSKNDILFLYTDGVTEANNSEFKLYGEDRLINTMNNISINSSKDICSLLLKDLEIYSKGIEQSDDITMLSLRFK